MLLSDIREFNGTTWYGYTYGTDVPYWSMRYYSEADLNNLRELRRVGMRQK